MDGKDIVKIMTTSFHKNQLNKIIDECTGKTLDFESSKLLKEAIEVSMDQICGAFIDQITKLKKGKENG